MKLRSNFPDFLAPVYEPETLERCSSTLAAVDGSGVIVWVNEAWRQFARDNGGDADRRYATYLDGVTGPLREAYRDVFATALDANTVFEQDYECSSPDTIRRFRMRVLPFSPHGLLLEHTPVAMHGAPAGQPAIEALYRDPHGHILQCSNCRRVRRTDSPTTEVWAWVPTWVATPHPQTSHGLCSACAGYYWRISRRTKI